MIRPRPAAALLCALTALAVLPGCGASGEAPPRSAVSTTAASAVPAAAAASATPQASAPATAVPASHPKPRAELVSHGDPASREVALTFDLCETPGTPSGFDRKVVDLLERRHVPATFFMGGHWAETHPEAARGLGSVRWFEIASHSYAHKHPTRISSAAFEEEIAKAQDAISHYTGRTPTLFRFPYGEHDARTLRQVAEAGLTPVQWSVVTGDPDPNVTAKAIVAEVRRSAKGGAIVIMHANGKGRHTAEALPRVIDTLQSKGFRLVTVSELLSD